MWRGIHACSHNHVWSHQVLCKPVLSNFWGSSRIRWRFFSTPFRNMENTWPLMIGIYMQNVISKHCKILWRDAWTPHLHIPRTQCRSCYNLIDVCKRLDFDFDLQGAFQDSKWPIVCSVRQAPLCGSKQHRRVARSSVYPVCVWKRTVFAKLSHTWQHLWTSPVQEYLGDAVYCCGYEWRASLISTQAPEPL